MSAPDTRLLEAIMVHAHRIRVTEALARAAGDAALTPGSAAERAANRAFKGAEEQEARALSGLVDVVATLCAEAEQRAEARLRLP